MEEGFTWEQDEGQHTLDLRIIHKEDGTYTFKCPTGGDKTCGNQQEAMAFMQALLGEDGS